MPHAYLDRIEPAVFRALMGLPRPVMRALAGRAVVVDGQVLDLETQWMLRLQRLMREPAVETLPMDRARAGLRRQTRLVGGTQPIGVVRELTVPGGEEEIPARLYVPRGRVASPRPSPLLFFVHGGGMMYGDLARTTRCAGSSPSVPTCGCSRSTTGSHPSTGSRPPWRTAGRRSGG
jgi:acetyl esterase